MDTAKYKEYAKARMLIHASMTDKYIGELELKKAARGLGILKEGTMVFQDDDDVANLIDFALRRVKIDGKIALEHALIDEVWNNEFEKVYVEAQLRSRESLYEVVTSDPSKNTVTLSDCLNKSAERYVLVDIGFAKSVVKGTLFYSNLVPIEAVYISTGVSFGFDARKAGLVLFEYRKPSNRKKIRDKAKTFKFFYRLVQKIGTPTVSIDV